ncbi:DUF2461 domain-containing protein [Modestobacter roseus]|uniref:Uncharacterized protein (TIGR02453 family) n=1 Tax=Modestobacter roseus TaxID=1181884 RepID=A0A562IS10_9ACTN|nr:DUF2461 domain-containing protein [Modestobacter roseus]MQA32534.1 TIGR02453 family protein [Modestobacter roseus]TWH73827.1 uncharacterized protein (TIGR02453 family) [Modestobacter roseus]
MGFSGFPDEGLVFYEGLEADNSRAYWTAHRADWETHVRAPMQALVDELTGEFGTPKLFRPYRDVRFSHDKTPYKTHQGAVLHPAGSGLGSVYVEISADGLRVAGGCWRLQPDQLDRFRRAVADDLQGPRLVAEVDRLRSAGYEIDGDRLVRSPRGWPGDHPRIELLRHKALHGSHRWEPSDWLHTPTAVDRVRDAWRAFAPLNRWLDDNVGATTAPPDRRR